MECLYCHHPMGDRRHCQVCGRDVSLYRKVVRTSNTYYNIGLEKARVRDLSGAAVYLKKSLDLYKKNTDARNLLGLVYYELGETVDALAEWVISKNLQPEDNLAAEYLRQLQSRQSRLNQMNQTLRKFNQALYYARHDSQDLALLQAKKVINMNPRFVKAYQLLGLLYLKKEEYAKAEKTLKTALTIDVGNTAALAYLDYIQGLAKDKRTAARERPRRQARELTEVAKKYAIIGKKEDELVPLFKSLRAAGGTAYNDMIAVLDQAVATVEKSGAFSEIGKSGHGSGTVGAAEAKVEAIAKGYMEKDSSLDYASAMAKAWEDNPELMDEYEAEAGF